MSEPVPDDVLRAWGFEGASVSEFERGLVNKHWLAERGGERLVFRRYHQVRTREAADWELELVAFAAGRGWATAPAVPADDGRRILEHHGRLWAALPFRPGEPAMAGDSGDYRRLGALIARLHADLREFPQPGQRPGFGQAWDLDAWVAPYGDEKFDGLAAALEREDRALASLLREERSRSVDALTAAGYGSLPLVPVHGDFQRFNLLWADDELTGILDFDFARRDARVCDLATMLVPFMPLEPGLAQALFDGYRSVSPLTATESAVLPLLARALLLVWVALLLANWRRDGRGGLPGGVGNTLTRRLPAVRAAEAEWARLLSQFDGFV